jgi:hypothetical protein
MDTSSERMADCHESLRDSLRGSVYRPDVMVNRLTHRIPDTPRCSIEQRHREPAWVGMSCATCCRSLLIDFLEPAHSP